LKISTHVLVGFCVASSASLALGLSYMHMVFSGALSAVMNWAIDKLGHKGFRRSPFMHSPFGLTILCVVLFISLYVALELIGLNCGSFLIATFFPTYLGVLSHLLLDAFTANGIYLRYPISKKRTSVLKARYDNPWLNALAIITFLTLFVFVLGLRMGILNLFDH